MDQGSWLWKKRSTEKTLVADKANNSLTKSEEVAELQKLQAEKTELERDLRTLNGKLSSALAECNAKDNIAKKQVKIAEEAIAGWERAELDAKSLNQELDKVLSQKIASEERICNLDAALKECMQQLRYVREEQDKRVQSAVVKTSEAFEKIKIALDERLAEAGKKLTKVEAENTQLIKALPGKDKVIEDLSNYQTRLEADFNALMLRVETTEKENASLKYEVCVLEKELHIRNEEREFDRRTAEVAQKQHQEDLKKIGKLEVECQKLRILFRKRLPDPATLAKMKREVEVDQFGARRRKSNPSIASLTESCIEMVSETPSKQINTLIGQLDILEEENKTLKIALSKKSSELRLFGTIDVVSRLSNPEGEATESIKSQKIVELGKDLHILHEHSVAASSDVCSDDKGSCAESWASALISELEHFKNEKQLGTSSYKKLETSEINLMDDFAEMEKVALVSVDHKLGISYHTSEKVNEMIGSSQQLSFGHTSSMPGLDSAPVHDCPSEPLTSSKETLSKYIAADRVTWCLNDLLKMLLEHCHTSQRNPHEVLEDIKDALAHNISDSTNFCGNEGTSYPDASYNVNGQVNMTSPSKSGNMDASEMVNGNISNTSKSNQEFPSKVSISIQKVLELLEGIIVQSQDNDAAESFSGKDDKLRWRKNSENPKGYVVRVFQWKTAELCAILQQLVSTCNKLLNGTSDIELFAQQVASTLEWVINHCFSIQDVSSMKNAIRNHFDCDESNSDSDVDCGSIGPSWSSHNNYSYMDALEPPMKDQIISLNIEQADDRSSMADLEGRLQSEIAKSTCLKIQLQESTGMIYGLHSQMETVKRSKEQIGNQTEEQKMIKEDLEAKLMDMINERMKACEKISCLENELENKNDLCKRLEEACQHLQMQLKSMPSKEAQDKGTNWEEQLQNDWEITAASEKLAECQETILNLGKQLKALASPGDAALFDKVVSEPVATGLSARKSTSQRSSLLDKMLAEDNDQMGASPMPRHDIENVGDDSVVNVYTAVGEPCGESKPANGINHEGISNDATASMDIVPHKKRRGWSFLRQIFWRRKKGDKKQHN